MPNLFCCTFKMIPVFVFASLLSFLPFLKSATDHNTTCPESFSCPNTSFAPFTYPFYNASDSSDRQCGLIKVDCTSNGGIIQLGGKSYEIVSKFGSDSFVLIHNKTFETLVKKRNCSALMDNFTSPSPLLYSISIEHVTILYKCTNHPSYAAEVKAYFKKSNYSSYNKCKDHNFYYIHSIINTRVPSDLPHACQVIQLPVRFRGPGDGKVLHKNIFSLLGWIFSIKFSLTTPCDECRRRDDGQCSTRDGKFWCLNVKKGDSGCHTLDEHQCSSAKKEKIKTLRKKIWILVLAGSAIILIIFLLPFIIWHLYKKNTFSYYPSKNRCPIVEDGSIFLGVSVFSYTELEDATQSFDPSQELGNGGFGAVYYGKLQDGREVAVKRLYEHNYKRVQQFVNEVRILTVLRHPNLVVLYGCTSRQSHELLLVYEYISNGTLADHLHGELANPSLLTWPLRMNIAIETARALVYLHASEIIHRDVKTSNILLDQNFSAKVADFGLSRLIPNDVSHVLL